MKFNDHLRTNSEMAYCDGCPFLVFPTSGKFEQVNHKGKNQKNVCGVSEHHFGEADVITKKSSFEILQGGLHPVKKDGCLQLFEFFHKQLTKRKKCSDYSTCGSTDIHCCSGCDNHKD